MVKKVASKTSDTAGVGKTTHCLDRIYREDIRVVAAGARSQWTSKGYDMALEDV